MVRFGNVALLAIVLGIGTAAMELGVRLTQPQQLVRAYTLPDAETGTRLLPGAVYHDLYGNDYWVRINRSGFRQDDEVDMSPARRRVLVFGDSFTFGFGVNYEDSFFAVEKTRLETAVSGLQMLNAAVPAFSTGHIRKQMAELITRHDPAALIYFFNNNDILDNAITDPNYRVTTYSFRPDGGVDLTDVPVFAQVKRFLLLHTPYDWLNQNSHLFVLAKDILKRGVGVQGKIVMPEIGSAVSGPSAAPSMATQGGANAPTYTVNEAQALEFEGKFDQLIRLSIAHMRQLLRVAGGRPLLVVWIPSPEEMELPHRSDLPQAKLFSAMRAALADLAAETGGFRFVDTTRDIPGTPDWLERAPTLRFAGDGHFNADGNRWFADHIDGALLQFVKK